ncbi:hypothetical protein TcYC6_0125030 [Trypanosoma cruzi]|nr:hypothetical protein TcYC6_0125030 [Trypanosoma cruzi]
MDSYPQSPGSCAAAAPEPASPTLGTRDPFSRVVNAEPGASPHPPTIPGSARRWRSPGQVEERMHSGAHGHHHRPRRRCKNEDARSFPRDKATLGHQGVATPRLGGELGRRWLLQASPSSTVASPFPKGPALLAEGPSARVTRSPSSPEPPAAH